MKVFNSLSILYCIVTKVYDCALKNTFERSNKFWKFNWKFWKYFKILLKVFKNILINIWKYLTKIWFSSTIDSNCWLRRGLFPSFANFPGFGGGGTFLLFPPGDATDVWYWSEYKRNVLFIIWNTFEIISLPRHPTETTWHRKSLCKVNHLTLFANANQIISN